MDIHIELARPSDIDALVLLRLAYLEADHGALDAETAAALARALPGYFRDHLGRDLFCYVARDGAGMIAFASKFPGAIKVCEITPSTPIICQKKSFLACSDGVELSVHFQKKVGAGLFGGEGFVMQKISGNGIAFIEIDGSTVEYDLEAGQQLVIDTGYLAMMDATVNMEIQQIKGVKNALFGGEGLFNTVVTGPGRVLLQTMPLTGFAAQIAALIKPQN